MTFMVEKVKTQQADIALLQKQIAALEGKTLQEQEVKERLMAEKRFNQLFSEVKGYFQPEEAEVYRQENQLIVRLKAMQFPSRPERDLARELHAAHQGAAGHPQLW